MPKATQRCCIGLLLLLSASAVHAQSDTLSDHLALNDAIREYHAYLKPESGLYRGSEYIPYAKQLEEGHPYFGQGQMQMGSIIYKGILYKDLPLILDLVKGLLVTTDAQHIFWITLINEEVDSFAIQDHIFIRLKDSLDPSAPRPGFYEQLSNQKITVLKKEKKIIREDLSTGVILKFVDYSVAYYLKRDTAWYHINNEQELLHAFKDKRKELKKFLRSNGLKFRKDKENTLLRTAAWYENLQQK
jgi:hypothetical protein